MTTNKTGKQGPDDQAGVKSAGEGPACEISATCVIDGACLTVKVNIPVARVPAFLTWVRTAGGVFTGPGGTFLYTAEGVPLCPRHGVPMVKRVHQDDTWYSHGTYDDAGRKFWCRGVQALSPLAWELTRTTEPVAEQRGGPRFDDRY